MKRFNYFILAFLFLLSCKKSNFLDIKPNDALVVPESLADFQALLDNQDVMNGTWSSAGLTPALGENGADDHYIPKADYDNSVHT